MKEKLYQLLASRSPAGQERYQALRLSGTPRWRAAPALLRGAFSRRESARLLPAGSSLSALSLWESPAQLVQRLVPFDVVSFDVFDTLLLRAVDRPRTPSHCWGPGWAIPISPGCGQRRKAWPGSANAAAWEQGR